MKKRTIRMRIFAWLSIQTLLNFFLIGLALLCYDLYEFTKDHSTRTEELEELVVLSTVMAILLPMSLGAAWLVSRRLLRPWKAMMLQAESISDGQLDERIAMVNPSDEIGRLASTLNLTFDRYQSLLDRMQRFSYDVSHQLRNPLAAIRTTGDVCLKYPRTEEEYRAVIEDMLVDTDRLSRTVEQLLMLARSASGDLREFQTQVSLQDIAREVVREGQAIGEMRGVSVELVAPDEPLMIRGVPDLLREALANLLDNALKYSPDNEHIEVGMVQSATEKVRITVRDSGPGLSEEQKVAVFRPFERNRSSGKESVGLGLAIVADICQAHVGTFGVENNPGGGSCFWIEIPCLPDS